MMLMYLKVERHILLLKRLSLVLFEDNQLEETLEFMKKNVLGGNKCYLPETIKLCDEMNAYTTEFFNELVKGIN